MLSWTGCVAIIFWLTAIVASMLNGGGGTIDNRSPNGQPVHTGTSQGLAPQSSRVTGLLRKPLIGFTLNFHFNDDQQHYLDAVDEIADLGCNTLMVATPAFATNGASNDIRLEVGPGRGPYRERLIELIRKANERGLTTVLMPTVLFTEPRGGEWRGQVLPDSWDRWWNSYLRMTDHFLEIARESNVDIYIIGSELISTESQRHRWLSLIQHVRKKFDGAISYSGNFDAYHEPQFWDAVDVIGINGYFDLSVGQTEKHPPLAHVVKRWQLHREQLLAFAQSKGKQVLLTEVGYPSTPWGLQRPWDHVPYAHTVADHDVQRDGYDAFFQAWMPDLMDKRGGTTPFAGVLFYEWDPYRHGETTDTHYGIRGKPAYPLIQQRLKTIRAGQ